MWSITEFWDSLRNLNLQDWGNVGTILAAIAGAVAATAAMSSARATQRTVREMESARIAQSRPLILITARRETNHIVLVMKNYGGPAADVHARFAGHVAWAAGDNLNDAPLFQQPIPVLSPSEEFTLILGQWPEYWFTYSRDASGAPVPTGWSGNPVEFSFHLSYRDPFTNKIYSDDSGKVSIRPFMPTAPRFR